MPLAETNAESNAGTTEFPANEALPGSIDAHLSRFGLTSFRAGQREVISAVIDKQDCLCIMPTGGGKSLCYQLPAVMREGLTLVVSPLIALMKDQVDALQALGIAATFINSSLTQAEQRERMEEMAAGRLDLVYIAPERLRNQSFLEKVRAAKVHLLAVDEAHCISEWGHDFRPDYARLGRFRERLGWPQTIALTATATPKVRDDVSRQLQLRQPKVFITGFARGNLRFEVQEPQGDLGKYESLRVFLEETPGAGIIYAATRKRCEELVEVLREMQKGRKVGLYHAGLMPEDRRSIQDDFMEDRLPLIVATNAFGMGIDKPDLRFVIHFNMPGSLEAYYQEAGRAGRDGLPSRCLLLFSQADRYVQEFFIDNKYPPREAVKKVYDFLRREQADPIELTLQEIKDGTGLSLTTEGIASCEKILEKAQVLERLDSRQNQAAVRIDSDLPTLVDLLSPEATVQRKVM
ncbi:MAG: ATP-dependent DNA helicase RecQ, partial [Pirellulaceae bacterium]|nr:ATP-dependent DNA helicase RecQ [Pirellulaceae bacterium]